ncbi:TlpA family protein disulfide reductase [Spirosoma aerophilum]
MKTFIVSLLLTCGVIFGCHQQEKASPVRLPITLVPGYGPFHPGFNALGNDYKNDPEELKKWGKLRLPVTGVPPSWSHVDKAMVWLNTYQFIYQNFLAGNITDDHYKFLQESWNWAPDTTKLSEKPIKCYVYTLRGFDEDKGKWTVMVDTNNNLDFSDETAIYPEVIKNNDPYSYKNPAIVQYEIYQNGRVTKATVPMVIKTKESKFLYNFPQYAQATLSRNGDQYPLAIQSGFTRPDFEFCELVALESLSDHQRVTEDKLTQRNEIVTLGGVKYRNNGVDLYTNTLYLDPINEDTEQYSLQVGYPFRPFTAQEFSTKRLINFSDYKGKYVYVDFWGTWCTGCVADMPALKQVYAELDKDQFEFIGIVAQDTPQTLARFLKKNEVVWPQFLSDKTNKLIDAYSISGYPTSVLLDQDGVVIARNLRPVQLRNKLKELSKR